MDRQKDPAATADPLLSRTPMGARLLALDWSGHPLGPPRAWPDALRIALAAMLDARFPMHMTWGPGDVLFYNDAYAPVLGARHPWALGRPFREVWPEIWDEVSHLIAGAMAGESTYAEDVPLVVQRNGRPERMSFTYSCSPLRGADGEPAGVLNVVTETTDRVRAREVLGNMGEAYLALDGGFRIVDANAEALRLDGRGAGGLLGLTLWEAYPDIGGEGLGEALRRAAAERAPATVEHRIRWRAGREGWFEARAYPTDDGLAVFLRDVDGRRQREDALSEAETRLRALADNLPGGVAYQVAVPADNSSRRFIYLSAGFEALAGKPASEALADPEAIYGMMPSPYREAVAAAEEANVREMRPFDGSVPFVRPDGTSFWGRILAAPRRMPDGSIVFDGILLDETARRVAEERLRESEAKFQAIADSIDHMVWSAREDGHLDYYNQRWYDFVGREPGSMGGDGWANVVHPDDVARTRALWGESLATGAPYQIEHRLRHRSGRHRWVMGRAQPVRDEAGAVTRWFGTSTDIQDIVEAREVLAQSRGELEREVALRSRELDRVWRLSQDLFAVCDADGVVRRANPAWADTLGQVGHGSPGWRLDAFVHPDDRPSLAAALARSVLGRPVRDVVLRMRGPGGSERWHTWTFVGDGDGIHAAGRDVTEQRAAEEALRQAQKMEAVGQLTGGLAHDFNNLLTGIVGSLEMMQTRVAQGRLDAIPRYAAAAMSSANRAAALTHRLLAFARRQPLDPRPVDVMRLVGSLEELVRRTIGEMVALETVAEPGLWPTLCDPNQLESALLNLAINARDAMPAGGRIVVSGANARVDGAAARALGIAPGDYVVVSVSDTGTGMDAATLAKAFDPFFTTKPLGQGTGLGLSMIYGFARQSGGGAHIESTPGSGTTVRLHLPRHRGEAEAEAEADRPSGLTEAHRSGAGETVVVVEDEPVVRDLVAEVLGELGYHVLQAVDGPSGLRLLQGPGRVDLLVTDVGLPGLNGRDMAERAREGRPGLRVLFITGYAENATFGAVPGTQLITKPFTVETLAARVREMCRT